MTLIQPLRYGLILLFCVMLASCCNDDDATKEEPLNAADMKLFEKCGDNLTTEAVNCCITFPKEVTTDGFYAGGAKYVVNTGDGAYEPQGQKYLWKGTGEGIVIDKPTEKMVTFKFTSAFKGGIIEVTVESEDGSRCIALDTVYLKN